METRACQKWLEEINGLSEGQRAEVTRVLAGTEPEAEVIAALESRVMAERVCPHCRQRGAMCRGRANGLRRFHCGHGGKTFNALTGTPLACLHYKGRGFEFARALRDGDTVRKSAAGCAVAVSTAFRWRHRVLKAVTTDGTRLTGIVEADETFVPESRKGDRAWKRAREGVPGAVPLGCKARKQGGKASRRDLSREQVPVLVAADRSGATVSAV